MGQERLNALLVAELNPSILEDIFLVLLLLNSFLLKMNAKFIMDILFETLSN